MANVPTTTEDRALALLGSGIAPETVAASLGVSASRISQLLSDEGFAARVAELRYQNLAKHNQRDSSYDELEDTLLERMRDCIPMMHRPMEILKAISVINAAKRRGQSTPESIIEKQSIIQLTVPVQIINYYTIRLIRFTHKGETKWKCTPTRKPSCCLSQYKLLQSRKRNCSLPIKRRRAPCWPPFPQYLT